MRLRYFFLGLFAALGLGVLAGTGTLSSVSGGVVRTSHVNQYYSALNQDLVPRNSSGVATTRGGSLGTSSLKWLKAWIASGDWVAGDIKMHHTYNGTVTCGQGWMLMDGRIINKANYDAETGRSAGDWDTYVVTSPLDGKYLPNMSSKYAIGASTTSQTGASAITSVGATGNTISLAHTHTGPSHNHRWSDYIAPGQFGFDSGGGLIAWGVNANTGGTGVHITAGNDYYTEAAGTGATSSSLSASQDIRPESIQVQYCMRIID